jgi:spore germination protein KA
MFFWKRAKGEQPKTRDLDRLSTSLETNLKWLRSNLFADDDTIVYRRFKTKEPTRQCVLIHANNMTKHEFLSDYIVRPLMISSLPRELHGQRLIQHITEQVIQSDGATVFSSYEKLAEGVVAGAGAVLVEGCNLGISVDAQGWEKRSVTEPQTESVVRGPRQGFTEDLGVNVSLVRRKILSPELKVRMMDVGLQTRTKVAIMYVEGIAPKELVDEVFQRIERIETDAILESGYIEEFIRDSPNCPFPTIGHTERPDRVAGKILEGRVAVLVDGTPFALTMPFLFVEAFQANEDYFHHWMVASFHRTLRYISFFLTTSTPGLYLALVTHHPQLIPMSLSISIAAARKNVPFPAMVEVIAMGLVFEILREGGVRLPKPVGQAISIVGAIVLGEAAVGASLVSAPMIIVVGVTGVAGFVVSKLNDTAVLIRILLVFTSAVLGLYGFLFGIMGIMVQLASMESFGIPYLSSLTSLTIQGSKDTVIRLPWWRMVLRPRHLAPKNRERLHRQSRSKTK